MARVIGDISVSQSVTTYVASRYYIFTYATSENWMRQRFGVYAINCAYVQLIISA